MTTGAQAQIVISGKDNTQAAFASVSRSFKSLESMAGKLGLALPALSVGAAGGALAALTLEAAKAIDEFNDLRDATGASIENISALDRVARETGGSFDTAASILVKFNKVLSEADEESKGAGAVLKALGLDAEALKRIDPAEALRQTAVAFAAFAGNGDKARAIQVLYGKSVKDAAPFMKDLAEQTALVSSTTTKAAEDAEEFRKHLFRLGADAQDFARTLASSVIPVMNQVFKDFQTFGKNASLAGVAGDVVSLNRELKELESLRGASYLPAGNVEARITATAAKLDAAKARFQQADAAAGPLSAVVPGVGDFARADRKVLPALKVAPDAKGGTPKDPLAEAKRYLETLQKQSEKLDKLTTVEQTLLEIQKGRLGIVTPALQKQLLDTARLVDLKEAEKATIDASADAAQKASDEAGKLYEESIRFMEAMATPAEKLASELERIAKLGDNNPLINDEALVRASTQAWKDYTETIDKGVVAISQFDEFSKQAAENIQDAIGDGLVDVLDGNFKDIGDNFGKLLKRMAAEALAANISRGLFGDLVAGGSGKGVAGDALAGFGKLILGGGGSTPSTTGDFSRMDRGQSASSGSSGFGAIASFVSSLFSYDVGTDYVPQDMVAKIHKGERIIPAAQNRPGAHSAMPVFAPVFHIDSRADAAQVRAVVSNEIRGALAEYTNQRQIAGYP